MCDCDPKALPEATCIAASSSIVWQSYVVDSCDPASIAVYLAAYFKLCISYRILATGAMPAQDTMGSNSRAPPPPVIACITPLLVALIYIARGEGAVKHLYPFVRRLDSPRRSCVHTRQNGKTNHISLLGILLCLSCFSSLETTMWWYHLLSYWGKRSIDYQAQGDPNNTLPPSERRDLWGVDAVYGRTLAYLLR